MTTQKSTHNTISRRHTLISAGILGLGASLGVARTASAHQVTEDSPAGLTFRTLCAGESSTVAGKSLVLQRITLQPGSTVEPHTLAGPVALFIESGRFGTALIEGSASLTHRSADGMWEVQTDLAAGDDVTMYAGDHLFHDGAVHTMRNDGDDVAVLLVTRMMDAGLSGYDWFG